MEDPTQFIKNLEKQLKRATTTMKSHINNVEHIGNLYTPIESIKTKINEHEFSIILTDNGTITINSTKEDKVKSKELYEQIKGL